MSSPRDDLSAILDAPFFLPSLVRNYCATVISYCGIQRLVQYLGSKMFFSDSK